MYLNQDDMASSFSLKRKAESSGDDYADSPSIISEAGDVMLSPTKKRKLEMSPLPMPDQASPSVPPNDLTDALVQLNLSQADHPTSNDGNTDTEETESNPSTARTTPERVISPPRPVLAIYLDTPSQPFILVKPSFAVGGFARCSIWLGLNDRRLYVRKLQGCCSTPKDVTHYVEHSGVPKLVSSLEHGKNPNQPQSPKVKFGCLNIAIDKQQENLSNSSYWSTMSEYVNGPTLLSVFEKAANTEFVFPEPAIWQCGLVLLEILRKMRFPDITTGGKHFRRMSHNDIYPRNILLANDNLDPTATTNFYLIDFGIATLESEPGHRWGDLSNVLNILCSMMLNQNLNCTARSIVKLRRGDSNLPYSNELQAKVAEMEQVNMNAQPCYGFPIKYWFDKWIGDFRHMLERSTAKLKKSGKSTRIPLQEPLTIQRPWLFRGDKAVENMTHFMAKQGGCSPYQRVWLEEESLKVVKVEEEQYWNKPEADAPLREAVLQKKGPPVAPW
ncbi:hypothetical protein OHC33_000821 [Knufia fluminis]|uniref:Protein kinase domain-containing protein n=3 Tax=Knufia TaxID=430999 RepID=A0AAN8EKU6_9EURO|nr:hypothetical protein OHC33_000821 [Knufia fluminis]